MDIRPLPKLSFIGLLVALVAVLVLQPFLAEAGWATGLFNFVFSLLLLAALSTAAGKRRTMILSLILATPALLLRWLDWYEPTRALEIASFGSSAALLVLTTLTVITFVMRERRVTTDTISGAVCAYLLIAVTFALLMALTEFLAPGSFSSATGSIANPASTDEAWFSDFIYLSLVTITTLGYGDITPVTRAARVLTTAEAIIGQLYITIFIARLVGLHIAGSGQVQRDE